MYPVLLEQMPLEQIPLERMRLELMPLNNGLSTTNGIRTKTVGTNAS